ncbi:MAG TPA: AMP-binding protein [Candidatus Lokiarchaeia archaeon]|nr:AMP-binding protein [Candidatus Lokiarchaeia archaeon]
MAEETNNSDIFTGEMLNAAETKPWLKYYGDVPEHLDYPNVTLYERLMLTVEKYPNAPAWDFSIGGMSQTYKQFAADVDKFADGLAAAGFKKSDIMTISMPTSPSGVIPVYAVNKLGGIASMIHPLSPAPQIKMYLNLSGSTWALTMDALYGPFAEILKETSVKKLVLAKLQDYMPPAFKPLFWLAKGRKIPKVPADDRVLWFSALMKGNTPKVNAEKMSTDDTAIILYSGGTTGIPKGIELTNMNMISEGMQVTAWGKLGPGQSLLAILPIFHGFGLGVCVNTAFMAGGKTILIPQFTPESVAKLIKKKHPNFLVGVPTLFENLATNPDFCGSDLSCLTATFCGADTLPRKTKEKFESVTHAKGATCNLLEGYGLTEAVTAIMATPLNDYREGSVGVPFPDMLAQICKPGTTEEAPCGEEGEICISGPAVMKGYLNNPEATEETLKTHDDGRIWLHTGDLGRMDKDGFFYFITRIKRMLKVSGFNVYPAHVEETLRKMPDIEDVCIIGIPDEKQVTRVKAFVILKDKSKANGEMTKKIQDYGIANLLKYESPRDVEFRDSLPKTLIGKIAFKTLEDEELEKLQVAGKYPFNTGQ